MERMARESAELAASKRDAAGITRSLTPEEVKKRNAALKAASEDPDRKFYQSTIPIEDRTFPAEAEQADGIMSPTNLSSRLDTKGSKVTKYDSLLFETGTEQVKGVQGVLTQLGYVPRGIDGVSGAGTEAALRSFQEQNDLTVTGLADADTISKLQSNTANRYTFSDATDTLLEEFADVESDEAHLGTDFEAVGITLAYGIVPTSGLKYNHQGTIIDLPTNESDRWSTLTGAGVTAGNFSPSNVLIDDVVKEGVRRGDYRSDEEWTKAVITSFEDKVKARARVLDVDLSEEATEALTSYTWNTGSGTLEGDAMTTAITELGNDNPDYNTIATGFMNRFTQRGGGILQSLGRRRANEANTLLEAIDSPWTIESYRMQRTPQGREQFVFTTSEGAEMIVNADDGTRGMDPASSFPTRNLGVN
jgi:GH24 family phage-related lysozyme (muramidase)